MNKAQRRMPRRPRRGRQELRAKLEPSLARTGRRPPWQESLAGRVKNVLARHGLTLEEARRHSDASLLRRRGIGPKILAAIRAVDDATLKGDT